MTADANNAGSWLETFYQDLQTLFVTTFTKTCPKCESTFASQEELLREFAQEGGDTTGEEKEGFFQKLFNNN